jgi:hypothetical protein
VNVVVNLQVSYNTEKFWSYGTTDGLLSTPLLHRVSVMEKSSVIRCYLKVNAESAMSSIYKESLKGSQTLVIL